MTTDQNQSATSTDKALERVRKLFAKAESVAGTPEAEILLERAYVLLAKYGVDEALARGSSPGERAGEVTVLEYAVTGRYQPDQVGLVAAMAAAMHCRSVTTVRADGARIVYVVGVRRHVERIGMLAGALTDALEQRGVDRAAAQMVAEAAITVFRVGFDRWATGPGEPSLQESLREALAQLRTVVN